MAPSIGDHLRSFWHELTSNDRHATLNSPYRTGSRVAISPDRHQPLTSVSTSAFDSRTDLSSPYRGDSVSGAELSANAPYSPGMRTTLQRQSSAGIESKLNSVTTGEIQMQSFDDGLPPPPPVHHSWQRIDRWMEDNYEELWENLGLGATVNDINELEHDLDCTLPQDVRDSLQIHDGQERGGIPTGVVFGCMLLDCEEIVQEWRQWRTVHEAYLADDLAGYEISTAPAKAVASSSSSAAAAQARNANTPGWRQELQEKQDSQPTGAVQLAYSHPAWIPLARDWGGNNICVDLAPGPAGRWGQIILMGRDYDCKYVVARSWAAFLATLADDMNSDKWFIEEESKELKLREFKQEGVEPAYIDILRWRSDQKHGRKPPRRRPARINSQANGSHSPYGNAEDGRGRSPQRLSNGKQPTGSPRGHVSSPLARVAEEAAAPLKLGTGPDFSRTNTTDNLMSLESPVTAPATSFDPEKRGSLPRSRLGSAVLSTSDMSKFAEGADKGKGRVVDAQQGEATTSPTSPSAGKENVANGGIDGVTGGAEFDDDDDGEMKDVKI